MHRIDIKPLSINEAWKGRRFKTQKYKSYARDVGLLLPRRVHVPEGLLEVYYEFGLSNMQADYDNPVKALQDILQAKYGFDDSRIMRGTAEKVIVAKGEEYIKFSIRSFSNQ